MICARYIINYEKESGFIYAYDIELVEGNLVTEEVYTSHKFDITEFRVERRKAYSTNEIYETREAAEAEASKALERSRSRWAELGKLLGEVAA